MSDVGMYVDGMFPHRNPKNFERLQALGPRLIVLSPGSGPLLMDWVRRACPGAIVFKNTRPWSVIPWRVIRDTHASRRCWDLNYHISYVADRYHPEWVDRRRPAYSGLRALDQGERPDEFLAPFHDNSYVDWLLRSVNELNQEFDLNLWHEWSPFTHAPDWYPVRAEDFSEHHAEGMRRYLRGLGFLRSSLSGIPQVGTNVLTRGVMPSDAEASGYWYDTVKIEWSSQFRPANYADPDVDESVRGPRWFADKGKTVFLEVWKHEGERDEVFQEHWEAAKTIKSELKEKCLLVWYPVKSGTNWPDHRTWPGTE